MPRELTLVSTGPVTTALLVEAAVGVDGALVPRLLFGGWATQLVDVHDVPVLTIELSRQAEDVSDLERLIGGLPSGGPLWWTEMTAPWGPAGGPGTAIAQALGVLLGARLVVADGR
ncbi:hypothetical protein [uncultured Friedmanniella sp.]|uniref:hypothetical protein n=1 Tax=uncultured Friedmanniella sp. TaxID=335381 RepID=UPI0035CC93C8